jgi:hypothetical protein
LKASRLRAINFAQGGRPVTTESVIASKIEELDARLQMEEDLADMLSYL